MKTTLPAQITTVEEAKAFLSALHANSESYHPEDDAHTVQWTTGESISQADATQLNKLMEDIYNLPGNDGRHVNLAFDPCEYLLSLEPIRFITLDAGYFEVAGTPYTVTDMSSALLADEVKKPGFSIQKEENEEITPIGEYPTWGEVIKKLRELI